MRTVHYGGGISRINAHVCTALYGIRVCKNAIFYTLKINPNFSCDTVTFKDC